MQKFQVCYHIIIIVVVAVVVIDDAVDVVVVLHWIGKLGQNILMFTVVVVVRHKIPKPYFPNDEKTGFFSNTRLFSVIVIILSQQRVSF